LVELAGLEPATSWVRLARSPFGMDRLGLLRSRWLRQVRSDALSSVSRLVARLQALERARRRSWPDAPLRE
jgi:hypothetical protein